MGRETQKLGFLLPLTILLLAAAATDGNQGTKVHRRDASPAIVAENPPSPLPATAGDPAKIMGAEAYAIDWYSLNSGGTTNGASTNYQLGSSVGQSVAGAAASTNYQMGIGFWYGAGSAGGCACDCFGDPGGNCDGVRTVLDVVQAVNVAFRNAAPILDPNANCPYQTTDVNCSNSTEVLDVVKMVNVAFRNGNPATEFCNPCP